MKVICDINTSFQNSIIGLATIIYQNVENEMSFDDITKLCKDIYNNYNLKVHISAEDVYEAILLLYCKEEIDFVDGKVSKLK